MGALARKKQFADESVISERTKELYERWSLAGRDGVIPLSDDELGEMIMLVETALGVLRGLGSGGHFLTGLILMKDGMDGALTSRVRDR